MMTNSKLYSAIDELNEFATTLCRRLLFVRSVSHQRLRYKLPITHAELATLRSQSTDATNLRSVYLSTAEELLKRTQAALDNNDSELGWHCFKAATRFHLYGLEEEELVFRARAILREACDEGKAISVWRKIAIVDLLADKEGRLNANVTPAQVAQAAQLLDEHMDNMHQKLTITRTSLITLSAIGTIILAFWIILSPPAGKLAITAAKVTINGNSFWFSIILAGIVGALVSGFTSLIRTDHKARIPIELAASTITYARIVLAALSALAISLFLGSGLINLGELHYELALVLAFIAGFSERFLVWAIEAVIKPENEANQAKPKL